MLYFSRLLANLGTLQQVEVLKTTSRCTPAERCSIMSAWDVAKAYITYSAALKLQYTTVIPFLCAGMMHHDVEVARSIAALCTAQFDGQPDVSAHHQRSVSMLSKHGPCRAEVDAFIRGAPPEELPHFTEEV